MIIVIFSNDRPKRQCWQSILPSEGYFKSFEFWTRIIFFYEINNWENSNIDGTKTNNFKRYLLLA